MWWLLLLCLSVNGLPRPDDDEYEYYNEQEYSDGYDENYDEDGAVSQEQDNTPVSHRPVLISQPLMLDVDNGMTIRLPCNVDSLPGDIPIIWTKEDDAKTIIAMGEMVLAAGYRDRATVSVDNRGSVLSIGIAKSEDAGQYRCEVAVQGSDRPQLKHTVRIRAPPSISVLTPALLEVRAGDEVTLQCAGSGSPAPTLRWSRVGRNMPDGAASIETEVVVFSSVTRKHSGTYRCTASNGHGKEAVKEVEVVVEHAPLVEVTEMFVHTGAGAGREEEELVCLVHAAPAPTVSWTRDGRPVLTGERVRTGHHGSRHTLTIARVEKADYGKYVCEATNKLGTAQAAVELSAHAAPARFSSSPRGRAETEFLLEWTVSSFTPVTQFRLEVADSAGTAVASHTITPLHQGPYTYAGKHFLSGLSPASQYSARVRSTNGEGEGQASPTWQFATVGAEPRAAQSSPSPAPAPALSPALLAAAALVVLLFRL